MKYYDIAISLGEYCCTTFALRRCHLQTKSMVFDWSAGIEKDKCGLGGLQGKVDLICNDFKDFFNFEDFENRGQNAQKIDDTEHLWIVNKRTGLQYKHDFPSNQSFEATFDGVKEKYLRRVDRLYKSIEENNKILFLFIAKTTGFSDDYLLAQQQKIALKFPNKQIDFLYIMHADEYDTKTTKERRLNDKVTRIDCDINSASSSVPSELWNGNTDLYYSLLKKTFFTPATIDFLVQANEKIQEEIKKITQLNNEVQEIIGHLKDNLKKE